MRYDTSYKVDSCHYSEGTSSSGSFSGPTETAKVQMNLQRSQLRVSNTMFVKGPRSFNSLRAQSITKDIVGFKQPFLIEESPGLLL
jgi:hypothetical protein